MQAILLAAGLGTRLKPLTDHYPKPLIPVNGIPLIFYNLALLKKWGVKDVVINLHYMAQKIKKVLGDGSLFGVKIRYSMEPKILGTGGGIRKAHQMLHAGSFLVMNSDIIIDVNLQNVIKTHTIKHHSVTLIVIESPRAFKLGVLKVDADGKLASILGCPETFKREIKNTFFTGVHFISPSFIKNYQKKGKTCIIRDGYIPYLENGGRIGAYLYDGFWNDLGTIERIKQTEKDLKRKKIVLSYAQELEWMKNQLDGVEDSL